MRLVRFGAALLPCLAVVAVSPSWSAAPSEVTEADATGVLSRMVRDEGGRAIGRIVDVVVDPAGQPRAIVIDVGGFMGVGARRVAVAWSAVHVPAPGAPDARVTIDMTDEQVRDAPAYTDRGKPATIVGPVPAALPAEGSSDSTVTSPPGVDPPVSVSPPTDDRRAKSPPD